MIHYMLNCANGHEFEGWFGSSADFDRQKAGGMLNCPHCDSGAIEKALMAPSIASGRHGDKIAVAGNPQAGPAGETQPGATGVHLARPEIARMLREFRTALLENSEDVGERFGEEARRIHYGESQARGIHGKADLKEAAELIEEGIEVFPIPELPEDRN